MISNLRTLSLTLAAASLMALATSGPAEEAVDKRAALQAELAKVEADFAKAQADLAARSQDMLKQQHEIEYGDPDTKALKETIIALEKDLIAKRKELQLRIALNPKLKELENQRSELFRNVDKLRQTQQAIQNELKALDAAADVKP